MVYPSAKNGTERLMELYDIVEEFLEENDEMDWKKENAETRDTDTKDDQGECKY